MPAQTLLDLDGMSKDGIIIHPNRHPLHQGRYQRCVGPNQHYDHTLTVITITTTLTSNPTLLTPTVVPAVLPAI
jgi:hypothetical protein